MATAIEILQQEHRQLATVLNCLDNAIRRAREKPSDSDFELFNSIIYYLTSFTFRFHHPKEDFYLFDVLRQRCSKAHKILDELQADHRLGDQLVEKLRDALYHYQYSGASGFESLRTAAQAYEEFEQAHMDKEERDVLPLARKYLTPKDWAKIDAEFTAQDDPVFGEKPEHEFQKLFETIVRLAPSCDEGTQ